MASDVEYDVDLMGTKEHHLVPLWTVRDKYWWTQRFPAGRDLAVDHRYFPGTGGTNSSPIVYDPSNPQYEGKSEIQRYCMDTAFIAAVKHLRPDPEMGMPDRRVDYILITGANWARPIGSFRLVVDKGKPKNLVSFCETGVRKISPTQYEVRHRNWRPTRDLHVLIIEPQR